MPEGGREKNERFGSFYKNVVCVTEQHYVSIFFTRLWSVRKPRKSKRSVVLLHRQIRMHSHALSFYERLYVVMRDKKGVKEKYQKLLYIIKTGL